MSASAFVQYEYVLILHIDRPGFCVGKCSVQCGYVLKLRHDRSGFRMDKCSVQYGYVLKLCPDSSEVCVNNYSYAVSVPETVGK